MHTLLFLSVILFCQSAKNEDSNEIRKSGDCKLQIVEWNDKNYSEKVFSVTANSPQVDISCEFRGGTFFKRFVLSGNPSITNKSGKPLYLGYNVSFFDKNRELIATVRQDGDVKIDAKNLQFGSCMATIPESSLEKIASYQMVVYVLDPPKKSETNGIK